MTFKYLIPRICFLLLSCLIHQSILAQNSPINVLNANNGLPGGTIESGLMDRHGFIWLGTRDGLIRFDGKHIDLIKPNSANPCAIRSKQVLRMLEDGQGRIWFIGDQGIEVYFPHLDCFVYADNPFLGDFYSHGILVWLDSLDAFLVSSTTSPFCHLYQIVNDSIYKCTDNVYTRFYQSEHWKYGLSKTNYSLDSLGLFNLSKFFTNDLKFFRVRPDKKGFWVSTNRPGGFYTFKHGITNPSFLSLSEIIGFNWEGSALSYFDLNDSLGLASVYGYGIVMFDKKTGRTITSWDFRKDPTLVRSMSIEFLFKDPLGKVWFTILPYGLFVLDPLGPRFQLLKNGHPHSLLHNGLLRAMHCDAYGNLWLGFHDGEIQVLDSSCQKEIASWHLYNWNDGHNQHSVFSISSFPDSSVLVNSCVLLKLGKNGKLVEKWLYNSRASLPAYTIQNTFVPAYVMIKKPIESDNNLIVVSSKGFNICSNPKFIPHISNNFCDKNSYWISVLPQGNLKTYILNDSACPSLEDTQNLKYTIRGFNQFGHSDSVWMCGTGGLYIYVPEKKFLHEINTASWPNNYCYGILQDETGKYWISTNHGLIMMDAKSGKWLNFTINDGLQSNEFNTSCYAELKDGSLCFGGPEGINVFNPNYFKPDASDFKVYLRSIKINDKRYVKVHPYSDHWKVDLEPGENTIEFFFSSNANKYKEDFNYSVFLEGEEKNWLDIGQRDFARYINLYPGKYTFKILGKTATGRISLNQIEVLVQVLPKYHQTLWFRLVMIVLGLGLLGLALNYRSHQKRKLAEIRNRISRDLHDDIGSTLGSISVYSEVAKAVLPENREDVLEKIGSASREMLENINDIVWSIKPENDNLGKLEERMKSYAAMVLTPMGISFNLKVSADIMAEYIPSEKRRNLYLIFKEAIFNAVKYSSCSEINIVLSMLSGKLYLEVKDNGKGINSDLNPSFNGNGIPGMAKRAKEMGATIEINSQQGLGTTVKIKEV